MLVSWSEAFPLSLSKEGNAREDPFTPPLPPAARPLFITKINPVITIIFARCGVFF
jgi:hypothetical protein